MIHKKEAVTFGGNCQIPKDVYTVRVMDCSKSKSSKGNDMAVTKIEIVSPEEIELLGKRYSIAGRQHTIYNVLNSEESWGTGRFIDGLTKAGFDFDKFGADGDLDDSNLKAVNGFCFCMLLSSAEDIARHEPTPEQVAKKEPGSPILNEDGKQISMGWRINGGWQNVTGPASQEPNRPY